MSHASGTATDVNDLAARLNTWLTGLASPWTVDRADTAGTGRRLQVHKGAAYFSFRFANNENPSGAMINAGYALLLSGATGYNALDDWFNQTGAAACANGSTSLLAGAPCLAAAIPYFFFSDAGDDNVVVVVQYTTGVWNYLAFGRALTALGTWTGGQYYAGSQGAGNLNTASAANPNGRTVPPLPPGSYDNDSTGARGGRCFLRVAADAHAEEWRALTPSNWSTNERTTRQIFGALAGEGQNLSTALFSHLWARSRSQLAQAPVLVPCLLLCVLDSTLLAPLGTIPLLRAAFTRNVLADGASFSVGAQTYRAFGAYAVAEV